MLVPNGASSVLQALLDDPILEGVTDRLGKFKAVQNHYEEVKASARTFY